MAKNKDKAAKKAGWGMFKFFKRSTLIILLIAAGGFLFNLDRLGNTGVILLKYKKFLPAPIVRFLPGGSADDGKAFPDQEIDGKIIEVYDGDTATLLTKDNKKYKVRFFGIDAPESAQESGIASRDKLREKILGKEVTIKIISTDRYGRSVCKVMCLGRYINREMVAEGWAWYYADYAKNEYELSIAQSEAKERAVGIWKNGIPQPPWEWRKARK